MLTPGSRVVACVAGAVMVVGTVASLAVLDEECDAPDGNITTFADAPWWAASTMTTAERAVGLSGRVEVVITPLAASRIALMTRCSPFPIADGRGPRSNPQQWQASHSTRFAKGVAQMLDAWRGQTGSQFRSAGLESAAASNLVRLSSRRRP
jgi:voltage-gated potassium channel